MRFSTRTPHSNLSTLRAALIAALVASTGVIGTARAQEEKKINYTDDVLPILREHCFSCHSQDTAKSDLALDSYAAVIKGGAGGMAIEPGDPSMSRLWLLVNHQEEPKMPPEQDKLPEAKLTILREWITLGALETSGSTAKIKKKPTIDLKISAGAGKPEGPVAMPEGLSHQPIVYTARAAAATAIASSPWAPLVAVAGQRQILLYNSDTAELLGVLPFPEGIAHVLKFSRSGSLLLAAGGQGGKSGLAAVYDVRTGQRVFEVGDELDAVLAADINNNHSLVALGGPRRIVRIYSLADGSLVQEIRKHTDWIYSIEFSPDGVLLATADRSGGLFVWEADTAREYQNLAGHQGAVTDVSWRLDSNLLASCGEDTTIRLWEMENGAQVRNWGAHGGGASSVDFTHDGRLVSAGRDRQVRLWDQNGAQTLAMEPFNDLALEVTFSHDGKRVIGGDLTGEIRMWDAADGKLVAQLPANPPTLEMFIAAETERANAVQAQVDQAMANVAAAEQAAVAAAAALDAATRKLAEAATDADKAAAQADIDRLSAEKTTADQALLERRTALQAATDQANAIKQRLERAAAEKSALDASPSAQAKLGS